MSDFSPPDVRIVQPDFRLKRKIGTPLNIIFTPERILAAQKIFDQGKESLAAECMRHVHELRAMCHKENAVESVTLAEMIRLTLNVKGSSTMSGYPIASTMADRLHQFLSQVTALDKTVLAITVTLADAINAVFKERRTESSDALSQAVLKELDQNIRGYLGS